MLHSVVHAMFSTGSIRLVAGVLAGILGTAQAHADPTYDVTPITGLSVNEPRSLSYGAAPALNDLGEVVGHVTTGCCSTTPAVWKNGIVTPLGSLGGEFGVAYGINNSGQIVGVSTTSSGEQHAFLYNNGIMTDLGTLGGSQSIAYDVNNSGQVVGYTTSSSGNQHAFVYSDGTMMDFGSLGGNDSVATAINNSGQITGYSSTGQPGTGLNQAHAFLYGNGTMRDLGTLPGAQFAVPGDINNVGQIVGQSSTVGGPLSRGHSFLYTNGTMIYFGALPGVRGDPAAVSVNDQGQIVGWSFPGAFLYSNRTMVDLNSLIEPSLHITLGAAYAINNVGQILAGDNNFTNENFYLLTPTPVPEPSAWQLLCAGAVGLAGLSRWRRFVLVGFRTRNR